MGTTIGIRVRAGRGKRKSDIPAGYRRASYIENGSTAYVNTGTTIDVTTAELRMRFALTDITENGFMAGARTSYTENNAGLFFNSNVAKIRLDWVSATAYTDVVQADTEYDIVLRNGYANFTGTEITGTREENTGVTPDKFLLFNTSQGSAVFAPKKMKIYSAQLYDNGTLIRDYVPVQRISDSVYGLWDKVNKTFNTSPNGVAFGGG